MNILFIDNFDSFTFNLVDEFRKRQCVVQVWRHSVPTAEILQRMEDLSGPKMLVLSPGPGHPRDAGCCIELVRQSSPQWPIFGVCLGHQIMVEAFGGQVGYAGQVVHGKTSRIVHQKQSIFRSLPNPMLVGRYHSLAAQKMPDPLEAIAATEDGIVMALQHRQRPIFGVQFHPESILTPRGGLLIDETLIVAREVFQ